MADNLRFSVFLLIIFPTTLSLNQSKIFELIFKLRNPICPNYVFIVDQSSWNEEFENFTGELFQQPVVLMSSQLEVLRACGKENAIICSNVVVFSRDQQELTQIYNQLIKCFYVNQVIIITEMKSDLADRWLNEMASESIILILKEDKKLEVHNWIINSQIRRLKLTSKLNVTREDLGITKRKNLLGRFLRIATLNFPPVVFVNDDQGNSSTVYGIEPSLMEVMSGDLNFTFGYFPVSPSEMWGSVSGEGENRTATGLLGALMKKEADVALGNLYLDYTRLSIIGFSSYYKISEECFSVPTSKPYPKWTALYHPFSGQVWLATILSIFFCILTLRFVAIFSIEASRLDSYYRDYSVCFLTVSGHLFGLQQTQETRSKAIRIFLVMWLFGALIISTGYRSGLISFMTFPFTPPPIDRIQQLVESPIKKIIYDPLMKEILTNSNNTLQRQLGRQMITSDNLTYMFSLMDSEEWAVDSNLDNLRYVIATQYPMTSAGPRVHIMKECVFSMRAALGLQKESNLKPYFDREIQQLIESGLIGYHRSRFAKKTVGWNPKASQDLVSFSLDSLQGAFYSFFLFVLLSILVFFGEIVHAKIKHRKNNVNNENKPIDLK